MGFFSNRFEKAGPGVDPDAPQKRSFFRFFELFFRKFTRFIRVNLMYCLVMIPTFLVVFAMLFIVSTGLFGDNVSVEDSAYATFIVSFFCTNLFVTIFGMGPATAGITYIMRNFAREEHAWIWSDFKDTFKSNFKQAMAVYLINLAMLVICYVALMFYSQASGAIGYLKYVMYMIIVIFAMMNMYIYPMMITFKLKLKDIYRNALLFAVGKLPSNLLILFLVIFIHIGLPVIAVLYLGQYFLISLIVLGLLEIILTQSFTAFMVNFNVYPKMKKYMLDVMPDAEDAEKEKTLFEDDVRARREK